MCKGSVVMGDGSRLTVALKTLKTTGVRDSTASSVASALKLVRFFCSKKSRFAEDSKETDMAACEKKFMYAMCG